MTKPKELGGLSGSNSLMTDILGIRPNFNPIRVIHTAEFRHADGSIPVRVNH